MKVAAAVGQLAIVSLRPPSTGPRRHRILFVAKNLQQGGTERQILRMLRALDRGRFEIGLCTLSRESHYDDSDAAEVRFAFDAQGEAAVSAIAGCIDAFQPDVVHSFRDVINRQVFRALATSAHQPAWLPSVRGRPMLPVDILGTIRFAKRAYRITVNSVGIRETLRRFARVPAAKVVVVPNLVDPSVSRPATASARARARVALGIPDSAFVAVLPGRLSWVKNQLGLLCAVALLKLAGALPSQAIFLLAGRARDKNAARGARFLTTALRLSSCVRFCEAVKDVQPLYAAADALVLPSWAEGMPNVVLEAQLAALPVVVTHQANRDGLVKDGESGFTVTTGSPFALATALARLMRVAPLARRRMGRRGRAHLLETHACPPIVGQLERLYEEAIRSLGRDEIRLPPSVRVLHPAPGRLDTV